MAFVDHGGVPTSNTLAENVIRPLQWDGRTGVCDTVKEVESSTIVYSMVSTTKITGLDPYNYPFYVLSVFPYYGKSTPHDVLGTVIPWSSKVQQRIGKNTKTESE